MRGELKVVVPGHRQDKDEHVTHLFVDTAAPPPPLRCLLP